MLDYEGAAFVSEFPFGTAAARLTLQKRNKLIVRFALGEGLAVGGLQGP